MFRSFRTLALVAALGVTTTACVDDYGYGGLSVGYGSPGYYGGYGGYYDGFGDYGAFGSPYWGWFGDYYYPGTGYYVYDRYRRPHRWTDSQRNYWERRRNDWRGDRNWRDNWGGWDRNNRRRPEIRTGRWSHLPGAYGPGTNEPGATREQRRNRWQNVTPEQRQQWQQRREQMRPGRDATERSRPDSRPRGGWRGRRGGN